jgi:hypothetical protein
MKKVFEDKKLIEIGDIHLGRKSRKVFEKVDDLQEFQDGDYYEL